MCVAKIVYKFFSILLIVTQKQRQVISVRYKHSIIC